MLRHLSQRENIFIIVTIAVRSHLRNMFHLFVFCCLFLRYRAPFLLLILAKQG
jgi:hypothetical protein